jgi:hypothetical protein
MIFATIIAASAKDKSDSLLDAFKQFGGGDAVDSLYVVASIYDKEFNLEFKAEADKYFDDVRIIERSLVPYDNDPVLEYSERVIVSNLRYLKPIGPLCYMPLGYVPCQKGWASIVRDEYNRAGMEYMGDTTIIAGTLPERKYLSGSFAIPSMNFHTVPMFKTFSKVSYFTKRASHYTAGRLHDFAMPFSSTPSVKPSPELPETSEDDFDVSTPKKIESLPMTTPAKKAAKKTARKKAKPRAKKKVVRKAPKKPSTPSVSNY